MRKLILLGLLMSLASSAQAHEVWIERDPGGPARIYLGKPLPAANVTILGPDRWSKVVAADEKGGPRSLGGKTAAKVHLVSTFTVVAR